MHFGTGDSNYGDTVKLIQNPVEMYIDDQWKPAPTEDKALNMTSGFVYVIPAKFNGLIRVQLVEPEKINNSTGITMTFKSIDSKIATKSIYIDDFALLSSKSDFSDKTLTAYVDEYKTVQENVVISNPPVSSAAASSKPVSSTPSTSSNVVTSSSSTTISNTSTVTSNISSAASSEAETGGNLWIILIIAAAIIILLGGGAAYYFIVMRKKQ